MLVEPHHEAGPLKTATDWGNVDHAWAEQVFRASVSDQRALSALIGQACVGTSEPRTCPRRNTLTLAGSILEPVEPNVWSTTTTVTARPGRPRIPSVTLWDSPVSRDLEPEFVIDLRLDTARTRASHQHGCTVRQCRRGC